MVVAKFLCKHQARPGGFYSPRGQTRHGAQVGLNLENERTNLEKDDDFPGSRNGRLYMRN